LCKPVHGSLLSKENCRVKENISLEQPSAADRAARPAAELQGIADSLSYAAQHLLKKLFFFVLHGSAQRFYWEAVRFLLWSKTDCSEMHMPAVKILINADVFEGRGFCVHIRTTREP